MPKIFFFWGGKGLYNPPPTQLPPPLTSYLKLRGGGQTEDELTDRTHTRIVSFIVLDFYFLPFETTNRYFNES